jgi:virginiamycin B lyase
MNPYPAIQFTIDLDIVASSNLPYSLSLLDTIISQLSTFLPIGVAPNIIKVDGDSIIAYGKQAIILKNLVDQGVYPVTYEYVTLAVLSDYLSGNAYHVITGVGFAGASTVKFGNVDARWFWIRSDTEIHTSAFPVPTAKTVPLTISGSTYSSRSFSFNYNEIVGTSSVEYTLTGYNSYICRGPDDNLWVTDYDGFVWKVPVAGVPVHYPLGGTPYSICTGPDGNLWVVNDTEFAIQKVTVDGEVTSYPLDHSNSESPVAICVGPDSNLWISSTNFVDSSIIFKMTVDGETTAYPLASDHMPYELCIGPNGNIWIGDLTGGVIEITTTGEITYYSFAEVVYTLCVGPDGNLWGTSDDGYVIKITTEGVPTSYLLTGATLNSICAGPDGNLWVVDYTGNMWKVTTEGVPTSYPSEANIMIPCVGPDGNIWVNSDNDIIKVV